MLSKKLILSNGDEEWRFPSGDFPYSGVLHREEGPAVITYDGTRLWYRRGELHRVDGPAIMRANGDELWLQNGLHHRIGGPAITYVDYSKYWFLYGQRHRLDGPAVQYIDGERQYYINDGKIKCYNDIDFSRIVRAYCLK